MKLNKRMRQKFLSFHLKVNELDRFENRRSVEDIGAIIQVGNCFFLKPQFDASKSVSLNDFPDETGYECFVNHVHFDASSSKQALRSALCFSGHLERQLSTEYFNQKFRIIVSLDAERSTVRFHLNRMGQSWLVDDLESYKDEGVMVVDTPSEHSLPTYLLKANLLNA